MIAFLNNPNPVVKANAAAYLQHLCYNRDPVKEQTRILGGVPLLVGLVSSEQPEVHRNACGALRYAAARFIDRTRGAAGPDASIHFIIC